MRTTKLYLIFKISLFLSLHYFRSMKTEVWSVLSL